MIVILEEQRRSTPAGVCAGVGVVLVLVLVVLNVVYFTTTKCFKSLDLFKNICYTLTRRYEDIFAQ